jgi:outer membrane protein OmpA-like peptidoglycan-associated protein
VFVHPDAAVGSINEHFWPPGANVTTVHRLVLHFGGLFRSLTLCGYRVRELFVEASPLTATRHLLLDMDTMGLGNADVGDDGLDDARATGAPLLVALTLEPLWVFGEPIGAPLALALPAGELMTIDGVYVTVSETGDAWIGFTCDVADFWDAREDLVERSKAVAERLLQEVSATWFSAPHALGPPVGLGWIFDNTGWWFPPFPPSLPDGDARVIATALAAVSDAFSGALDVDEFLTGQLVRSDDPYVFDADASFGRLTRDWTGQSDWAVIDAYARRAAGLVAPDANLVERVADQLDRRYTWVDAVLMFVEHGVVGVGHRLLPGHPSTALAQGAVGETLPEWTDPQLTGQWDGLESTDTIILNQAGTAINGYWQRRVNSELHRYVLDGTMISGSPLGGPLTFSLKVWDKPASEMWFNDDATLGPPVDGDANIQVSQVPGGLPTLTLLADIGSGNNVRTFEISALGRRAHHTEYTLRSLPEPVKQRFRELRDSPLHLAELKFVEAMINRAVEYVDRFVDEAPSGSQLSVMIIQFASALLDDLRLFPNTSDQSSFAESEALMVKARYYTQSTLASVRPDGGDSHLTVLKAMFKATFQDPDSKWLQQVYGLPVLDVPPGTYFRYRWRLRNIDMYGAGLGIGGSTGTGVFELQRVDENGAPGNNPLITRTVDLTSVEVGIIKGLRFGPDDINDWQFFDPTYRDVTPHLDGATFSMIQMGASNLVAKSTSEIEVRLAPVDGLPALTGRIEAQLLAPDLFDLNASPTDPHKVHDNLKKAKELREAGKELSEEIAKKGLKGALQKGAKLLIPDVSMMTTDGWLRSEDGVTKKPDQPPIESGSYVNDDDDDWVRFATNEYTISPEFRRRVRQMLLWNLVSFSQLGVMTVEGHASQIGPDDYNFRLSRDRAMSVLTAMYDILGPQLAVPLGDIHVVGKGSTEATGDEDADNALDRRVDVSIQGTVRLRT